MSQHYSNPKRASDSHALPDIEVFYNNKKNAVDDNGGEYPIGWYYWYCFPGCLPDSDPVGPYETEKDAIKAAEECNDDDDDENEDQP